MLLPPMLSAWLPTLLESQPLLPLPPVHSEILPLLLRLLPKMMSIVRPMARQGPVNGSLSLVTDFGWDCR